MDFDPFTDEPRAKAVGFDLDSDVGKDLSLLSIDEIDERIAMLEREIARLKSTKSGKESSKAAASAFFNLGTS